MEYKSIQERNCHDALRHLLDARRLKDLRQIAAAEKEFLLMMNVLKDIDQKVWENHKVYLDGIGS